MTFNFTGRQVVVTDDFRELAEKKISKLEKIFAEDATVQVKLAKKRSFEVVEVTINSGGTLFRSEQADSTYASALDKVLAAIDRQIRKHKTKLEKKLRSGAIDLPRDEGVEEQEGDFNVRTKSFDMKPMNAEEAILQMNMLGHNFFVYEDDKTGKVNVVYARADGDYGLILPE